MSVGRRLAPLGPLLTLLFLGTGDGEAQSTEPPDTVEIEAVQVRILRSAVGTGMAAPVSVVAGAELLRGRSGA